MAEPLELKILPRLPADAFEREDDTDDSSFYADGRNSPPLDALAASTVHGLLAGLITEAEPRILDLMAGSDTRLPASVEPAAVVGLGLDVPALDSNPALTDRVVHDLNTDPSLPFADASFDVVLCQFAVEYLTQPAEVFAEVGRVLAPGGLFCVVFSNRSVRRKTVGTWLELTERKREWLVTDLMFVSGEFFVVERFRSVGLPRPADDPFVETGLPSDPVRAVFAEKAGAPAGRAARVAPPSVHGLELDPALVERRKAEVGRTHLCPYCETPLTRWEVPVTPFSEWDGEHVFVCLNNRCPYLCRGWAAMDHQGNKGYSYRLMYHPMRDRCMPTPIAGLGALRTGHAVPRG